MAAATVMFMVDKHAYLPLIFWFSEPDHLLVFHSKLETKKFTQSYSYSD